MSCTMGLTTRFTVSCRAISIVALALGLLGHSTATAAPADKAAASSRQQAKRVAAELTALHTQVNQTMALKRSSLVPVEVAIEVEQPFMMQFIYDGQLLTLDMVPNSVRANHYQVLAQVADGSFIPQQPSPVNTFRGTVLEIPGSDVGGGLQSDGLYVMISRPGGNRLWIEPVQRKVAGAPGNMHVVYSDSDRDPFFAECGTDETGARPLVEFGGSRGAACGTGLCFAELATDADVEYYQSWGSNVTSVENRINAVIAAMNVQYENDCDITHVITAIVVRTAEPDPYSSTNSGTLVSQLRTQWETVLDGIPRDITQLFTAKNIDGSIIGQAFNIGVVCSDQSYSYAQSDCCGSFARTIELHAHENGHVWNGIHCSCPGFTMHTPLNNSPLGAFTANNIARITSHRDSIGCLGTAAGLDPPFMDDFPATLIDSAKWTLIQGATVDSVGINEPSGNLSLRINGSDAISTNSIDLSDGPTDPGTYQLTYWWQRTGGGNSPEAGENLLIEYLNDQNQWTVLATHLGDGPDNDPFQLVTVNIPTAGRHPFFRLRIRGTSPNVGSDDFFIDDIGIIGLAPPEDNDFCGGTPVTVTEGTHAINTIYASTDGASVPACGGQLYNDIWYRYFPTCSGQVTVDVCDASFDARVAIYFVNCAGSALACNDNGCGGVAPRVTFTASAGFTYWIRVGATVDGVTGTGTLNIECPITNGACCMPDGSCASMTQTACTNGGGTFQGGGTNCGGVNCPQPQGACCMPDGSCNSDTQTACTNGGGTYQGNGTNCGGVSCPQPCASDISDPADQVVDVFDLFVLLSNWGTNGTGADLADPTNTVDVFDLFILLGSWGACP